MEITVSMRAHRKFKGIPNYRAIAGREAVPGNGDVVRLTAGEAAIGVYENVPGSDEGAILITDRGLHVGRGDAGFFIPYAAMIATEPEGGVKTANRLAIQLSGGSSALIPVLGGDPTIGTRDTYSMLMFLDHVIGDLRRREVFAEGDAAGVEPDPAHATQDVGV